MCIIQENNKKVEIAKQSNNWLKFKKYKYQVKGTSDLF